MICFSKCRLQNAATTRVSRLATWVKPPFWLGASLILAAQVQKNYHFPNFTLLQLIDEWLFLLKVRLKSILKGQIIAFPVWGDGTLLISTWQTMIHSCIALGCVCVSESLCQVKPLRRWKTWLRCFSLQVTWLAGSVAIRNEGIGNLEVDALIHSCIHLSEQQSQDLWINYATGTVLAGLLLAEYVYQ